MPQHDLRYFAKPLEEMLDNEVENRDLPEHSSRKVAIATKDNTDLENMGTRQNR